MKIRRDKTKDIRGKPPGKLCYAFFSWATMRWYGSKCSVEIDNAAIADVKPPFVAVCNHPSFYDWILMARALKPHRVSIIITRYYYYNRFLAPLLKALGTIPKDLFAPDIQTVRETIRVIKQGGAVGVFPEGRLSAYGQPETISPTTLRFLRRLGVPVIAVNIEGSYCVRPKWNTNLRKGAVKVTARPLFSAEDLKNLDDATAQQRLVDALAYDEHESALRRGASYEGADFARGLQNILYLCPKCGKTFVTDTEGNRIFCRSCANEGRLDGAYGLTPYGGSAKIPPTIAEWYILQKKREAGLIANNPDYRLRDEVVLKKPLCGGEMFTEVGSGEAILDKDGLHYRGTQHGQPFELDVPLHMISALPYGADCDFELTYHGEFYYFEPSRRRECVRWSVAAEQLYLHYVKGEVE